jgi:hypothetical protein
MSIARRSFGIVIIGLGSVALLAVAVQPEKVSPPPPIKRPATPTMDDLRKEATGTADRLRKLAEQYRAEWEKNPDNIHLGRFHKEMRADLAEYQARIRTLLAGAPDGTGPAVEGDRLTLLRELDRSAGRINGELEKLNAAVKEAKSDGIKERFKALIEAIDTLTKVAKIDPNG